MNKEKFYILTIIILVITIIVGCALQAQQDKPTSQIIVPMEGLTFKTPSGKVIAKIILTKFGGALYVIDNLGKLVSRVGADETGGTLNLYNNDGNLVIGMGPSTYGGGGLTIHDDDANMVAILFSHPLNKCGSICLYNNKGNTI